MRDNFESQWSRFAAKLQKLELKPKEGLHLNGDLSQRKFSFESFCVKVTAICTCRTAVGHFFRVVGVAYKKGREI